MHNSKASIYTLMYFTPYQLTHNLFLNQTQNSTFSVFITFASNFSIYAMNFAINKIKDSEFVFGKQIVELQEESDKFKNT